MYYKFKSLDVFGNLFTLIKKVLRFYRKFEFLNFLQLISFDDYFYIVILNRGKNNKLPHIKKAFVVVLLELLGSLSARLIWRAG